MSLATLSLAAALLVFGPLSDAIGRGGIMRLTLLAAGGLSLVQGLAPNFEVLLSLRVLQGFVLGGLPAVAIAWMGDEFERSAMLPAVGLYIAANSLGGIAGRVIGGWVAEVAGIPASFLTVGSLTLVGVALFWRLLPAARGFAPRRFRLSEALGDLAGHLRQPDLRGAYLLGGLNFLVFINLYSYLTFRLSAAPFSLDARWLGLLFLTYLGGTPGVLAVRASGKAGRAADLHGAGNAAAGGGHGDDAGPLPGGHSGGAYPRGLRFLPGSLHGLGLGGSTGPGRARQRLGPLPGLLLPGGEPRWPVARAVLARGGMAGRPGGRRPGAGGDPDAGLAAATQGSRRAVDSGHGGGFGLVAPDLL